MVSQGITTEVVLTEKGVSPMSDWKDVRPEDETMEDVASSPSAEAVVRDPVLNVDQVLCKLYGGILNKGL